MKLLNGLELVGFIKERQAHQVRGLRQARNIAPRLAIIVCNNSPVIDKYVSLKKRSAADILVNVNIYKIKQNEALSLIKKLNKNPKIHGIIVQLPLNDPSQTDKIVDSINPKKDVDGLGKQSKFESATPMAIMWLLAGYNIDLTDKNIVIVGQGRLVGLPLKKMLVASGIKPNIIDIDTKNPAQIMLKADVLITAVGQPGMINSKMIPKNCVVIDAATASEGNQIKGDLSDDVYNRDDLTVTPQKGGVGPLTVCALFENVIRSASRL
jgi:methylenetetrahydrofolate dehydrogenase (NADP+)/methenyltetrahydrofolate cyclohydrolase